MPDIPLGNQVFDLAFHPARDAVFAGLLTGEIKAFGYDDAGAASPLYTLRPTKRSCRGLACSADGARLFQVPFPAPLHLYFPPARSRGVRT